jgi:hypothetical protein
MELKKAAIDTNAAGADQRPAAKEGREKDQVFNREVRSLTIAALIRVVDSI